MPYKLLQKFLVLCLLLVTISSQAQKIKIDGTVTDTLGEALVASTILLMDKDSILLDYCQTDINGKFEFVGIRDKNALIKITYLGYFPLTVNVVNDGSDVHLGTLSLEQISEKLMEVVIKEAKAPLRMKGDTVEYDASQFIVPQGSSLESLLRKLPGVDVNSDGSLSSEGKNVTKLTVDGKTFFSSDPKFAIKNLPAESVSKVQVFDKKDEQALLTGQNSASDEKSMNIELKEEFKKGGFGKVTVGAGQREVDHTGAYEAKGNYNRFDKVNQLSLVFVGNNTGRNGLGWDDYQDFLGSSSFSFGDGYQYGFGGNFFRYFGGSNSSELESKISDAFFNRSSNGLPKNLLTGANYNMDKTKHKLSARYFYQNNSNETLTQKKQLKFGEPNNFDVNETNDADKNTGNHKIESEYNWDIDSLTTIIVGANFAMADVNNSNISTTSNQEISTLTSRASNTSNSNNSSALNGNLFNSSLLLRKKFMKPGRVIGANVSWTKTYVEDEQFRNSFLTFIKENLDSTSTIAQLNRDKLDKNVINANAMYGEPISKTIYAKIFYNLNHRVEDGTRTVSDKIESGPVANDYLSRTYDNNINNQRTGVSLTYSKNGMNFTLGSAYNQIQLQGNYAAFDESQFKGEVNKTFDYFIPYLEMSGNINRTTFINFSVDRSVDEPSIEDLLPVVDYSNPLFIKMGNPALRPKQSNTARVWFSKNWPLSGTRFNVNFSYNKYTDDVIQEQTVDANLITTYRPINYSGSYNIYSGIGTSFPIVKNKLKANVRANYNQYRSFAFIDNVLNKSVTNRPGANIGFDFTPMDDITLYSNMSYSVSNTEYEINVNQNQSIKNISADAGLNLKVLKTWFWDSNFSYQNIKNDRFNIDQSVPVLNISMGKRFLESEKAEVRIAVYDVFNKNRSIQNYANQYVVSETYTNTLARYYLLSFTYNIKGISGKTERNRGFH